jgi:hypothetical protein
MLNRTEISLIADPVLGFVAVMKERHAIHQRRLQGLPRPWTDDPILHEWRFCNIYRELDRVTEWITKHWRTPYQDHPDLLFAMTVARLVNWPDTLEELGIPLPWDATHFKSILTERANRGELVFGPAYVIPNGGSKKPKAEYLATDVLTPLWKGREHLRPKLGDKLATIAARLQQFKGIGGFIAGQALADAKYCEPLLSAPDCEQFAVSGPGSREGLNRILGRDPDAEWNEGHWYRELMKFRDVIKPMFAEAGLELSHGQDTQNMLCEWHKYERAREGRPLKRRYS